MNGPPNTLFHPTPSTPTTARPQQLKPFLSSTTRHNHNSHATARPQRKISPKQRRRRQQQQHLKPLLSSPGPITPTRRSTNSHTTTLPQRKISHQQQPRRQQRPQQLQEEDEQQQHRALAVESFHRNQSLKALLHKLQSKEGSDPLQILLASDGGDWSKEEFWAVIRFLDQTSQLKGALPVFDFWKNIEKSRINEANYAKIIELLSKSGMMQEAVSMLQEMKAYGLIPSVAIYNSIIHGFAEKGEFDHARNFLTEMVGNDLMLESETYNGLIQAYGNHRMYDEMCKCVKKMESEGCLLNHVTYNILIRVFAQGRLIEKMEGVHRTILSNRMDLQPLTLIAMLEAYADLGILEKMEKVYHRILNSKSHLNEGLIRKMAGVYIENYRFSRLEDLGLNTASRTGRTYLVWCLLLLSSACLMSRKGIESVAQEMEVAKVRPHVTFTNIIALAYLKMKDLTHLDIALSQLRVQNVKPDIVTVGVAFDANMSGVGGIKVLEVWRRLGCLEGEVEMKTDPLVLTAFGKGYFLRSCEELYLSLGLKVREKKVWTYNDLIDLVSKNNGRNPRLARANQYLKLLRS
ncbi:pentatricopeptide repeat-containing protein At4g14190, chloroplastic [Magnolia sinica]|uniref:pentatricopeptide repeat-containing protein At4g14190, chloroplastic n=1 Tax=Magnolia sinica TaxID=86752 RepID=UPI00265A976C|nr:pentatricopeptide repeat-containing protein At4g14190, chloroplastic [Magnolia sinica]